MTAAPHEPVLLERVIELLAPRPGGCYVDGTVGAGGHAQAILRQAPQASLLGLDRDFKALELAEKALQNYPHRLRLANFAAMAEVMKESAFYPADGILLDLGVSSMQLDQGYRGFSFQNDGPLDMRMSAEGMTAAQLIAGSSREDLQNILSRYGEEPFAGLLAGKLAGRLFQTTGQLARLVEDSLPARERRRRRIHPATLVFQALRIAVNDELGCLQEFLQKIPGILAPGGRLVIISYHSLEDRLVKRAFSRYAQACQCPPGLPLCQCGNRADFRLPQRRALRPQAGEVAANPRARSARMRVLEAL